MVRAAPTVQAPILVVARYGALLAVQGRRGGWAQVVTRSGRVGWVLGALLRSP